MSPSCYISIAIDTEPITLKRLLPPGDAAEVREIVIGLGLHERSLDAPAQTAVPGKGRAAVDAQRTPDARADALRDARRTRPYVVLNMVSTLDGRATLSGRSGPISDGADRELFHALRTVVDAVMVGAGTARAERYGPIVADAGRRRVRAQLGLSERPLACVVSARLQLPPDLPLLADPDSRVVIVTPSRERLPVADVGASGSSTAAVEYVRACDGEGSLDFAAALAELHDRLHVRTLLCEGGPHLNAQLLSDGLVDELFLSLSPMLAGDLAIDDPASAGPPRILAGIELRPPLELALRSVLEHDSRLFLRYRLNGGA